MIYIISHYYPPVQNPPARRMDALVCFLVRKYGAENVTVITGRPNHPQGILPAEFRWKIFRRHIGLRGERIIHLYELAAPNRGFLRKMIGYLTFASAVFLYLLFKKIKADDLVIITVPPVFTGYAVHAIACIKRKVRYIVDVRDLWPQTVAGMGFLRDDSLLYRMFIRWSDALYRRAAFRVGTYRGITDYYNHIGLSDACCIIPNTVDTEIFQPVESNQKANFRTAHPEWFQDDCLTILYAGTQSVYMGLDVLLRAVKRIRSGNDKLKVLLAGYGETQPALKKYMDENQLSDVVTFIPQLNREDLVLAVNCANVCFSSTSIAPIMRICIPTKIIEYLACGKFVIGSHDNDFVAELEKHGLARNVPAGDDEALAALIADIMTNGQPDTGQAAVQYVKENFAVPVFERKWEGLIKPLAG